MDGKIELFTDLRVWQEGHKLVIIVYKMTKLFPREETYSLVDQMRRAASSITSNIAEGFGRHSYKEKLQFYYLAHGSLTELENQLIIARDVGYLDQKGFDPIFFQASVTHQLLRGFIKSTKQYIKT